MRLRLPPQAKGSGVGLQNVQSRIRLYFGPGYGLTIESEPDLGTKVTFRLPAIPMERWRIYEQAGKTILTVFALALVLSLLALLLWQETGSDEPEILHLSVLLDGSEETAWRNFRRGQMQRRWNTMWTCAMFTAMRTQVRRASYRPWRRSWPPGRRLWQWLRWMQGFDRVSPESFCAPTGGSNGV